MYSPSNPQNLPKSSNRNVSPKPLSHQERLQIANKVWTSCQGLQIEENKPNFSKELPLKDLIVYVEMFTNGTNISEASYGYLTKLGAKVEKRMNKKCNLVIWKEGSIKTINKAKEYEACVVNSLWLEDCIENDYCAPFDKYYPAVPNESELPFITSLHENKGKRRGFEAFGSRSFDFNVENRTAEKNDKTVRKKRKTLIANPDDNTSRTPLRELNLDLSNPFTPEKPTFGTSIENMLKVANMKNVSPFYFRRLQNEIASPKQSPEHSNNPHSSDDSNPVKILLRKYTNQNFDSILNHNQTNPLPKNVEAKRTPEEKKEEKVFSSVSKITPFSDDTISMSEEFVYDPRTTNFAQPSISLDSQDKDETFKIDLNKIFEKYLQPKVLEPTHRVRDTEAKGNNATSYSYGEESKGLTPQKMNNWDVRKKENTSDSADSSLTKATMTRSSTMERSPLIRKYLNAQKEIGISVKDVQKSFSSMADLKMKPPAREDDEKKPVKTLFGRTDRARQKEPQSFWTNKPPAESKLQHQFIDKLFSK